MCEFRQHIKRHDLLRLPLSDQINACKRAVPEEMRSSIEMPD
jgi:hypothetical protein